MSAYFVTGTGTSVGKTYVTCGIVRAVRAAGQKAMALKPIVSGYDARAAAASDPGLLLDAMGVPVNEANIAARALAVCGTALAGCGGGARGTEHQRHQPDQLLQECCGSRAAAYFY